MSKPVTTGVREWGSTYLTNMKINRLRFSLLLAFAVAMLLSGRVEAQTTDAGWPTLARVTFTKEYDELLGLKVDKPVFAEAVKALDGKTITLKGYVIPTEGYKSHKEFVFSAYPYSMCFFCGGAGPETVVEVFAKAPIEYSPDAITIQGTLRLNADDPNSLMYRIEDVREVKT